MQTVILCGGRGLRLGEIGEHRPKALVEVGGFPVIWHVMKHFAHYGFRDFILCLGYKGEMIREYFLNRRWSRGAVRLSMRTGRITQLAPETAADWSVTFVDTGTETQTGGRLLRAVRYIEGDRFLLTYADGVTDVDLRALVDFHLANHALATVTGVHPPSPFGLLEVEGPWAVRFQEKAPVDRPVSGGYFVFERDVLKYLDGDNCVLEQAPLRRLAAEHRLAVYRHEGFWDCMDTAKDVQRLEQTWAESKAWKVWED